MCTLKGSLDHKEILETIKGASCDYEEMVHEAEQETKGGGGEVKVTKLHTVMKSTITSLKGVERMHKFNTRQNDKVNRKSPEKVVLYPSKGGQLRP